MKKNKKTFIIIGVILAVVIVCLVIWLVSNASKNKATEYQTATIERGELLAIVGATGTVRARQTAILAWQATGRIASIDVALGDSVHPQDILAALATDSLSQSVIMAQADLVSAQRNLDNLLHSGSATAKAMLNLANAQSSLEDAKQHVLNASWQRGSQDSIDAAQAQVTLAQQQVDAAQTAYDLVSSLPADNPNHAYAQSKLAEAERALRTAQANLNWLSGRWDNSEIAINDAKLAVAQAAYDDAVREWERVKDGPAAEDIQAAQAQVDALLAMIGTASLKSPIAGTVTAIDSLVGDQVSVGKVSFRVDDLSRLFVDIELSEIDIASVKAGQEVSVTLDAIQGSSYSGTVVEVAPVGDVVQDSVSFKVVIQLLDADERVLPGMTAAVNIVINRLEDVLLVPNRAIKVIDGKSYIFLMVNGELTQVEVTRGAASDTQSEILAGDVKEGDSVILNPPSTVTVQGPFGFMRR